MDMFCTLVERLHHPHFGVNYDPSNAFLEGGDPMELLERVKHRVVTMHASDRYLLGGTLAGSRAALSFDDPLCDACWCTLCSRRGGLKEELAGGVGGFVVEGVVQGAQGGFQGGFIRRSDLQADERVARVGTMIVVVEKADVPTSG